MAGPTNPVSRTDETSLCCYADGCSGGVCELARCCCWGLRVLQPPAERMREPLSAGPGERAVGWDIYRRLDRLPYLSANSRPCRCRALIGAAAISTFPPVTATAAGDAWRRAVPAVSSRRIAAPERLIRSGSLATAAMSARSEDPHRAGWTDGTRRTAAIGGRRRAGRAIRVASCGQRRAVARGRLHQGTDAVPAVDADQRRTRIWSTTTSTIASLRPPTASPLSRPPTPRSTCSTPSAPRAPPIPNRQNPLRHMTIGLSTFLPAPG